MSAARPSPADDIRRGKGPGAPSGPGEEQDFHAEDVLDRPFDRNLALRLLAFVRPYRRWVALSFALIVTTAALQLAGPLLIKEAISGPITEEKQSFLTRWLADTLVAPGIDATAVEARGRVLAGIVALYLGVMLLAFLSRYCQTIVMSFTGQNVMRDLRVRIFEKLQVQSLGFFQRQPVGRLVTRVTADVEALNELFASGFVTIAGDVLTVVGIVVVLFVLNSELALLALSVSPFLVGVTLLFRVMARKYYREIRRTLAHLNAFTQESIIGLEIIQVSRREEARAAGYERINERYKTSYIKSIFWYGIFFPCVELFSVVSMALVVWHYRQQLMLGTVVFGEFFVFWMFLNRFFVPIRDLAEKYNLLQAAMASGERIFGILDTDTALPVAAAPRHDAALGERIRFEDVWFAYDGDHPVLKGVDFEVARGETVALVGATGAGKSTIVNLLLRFHDPTRGRVLIDGTDLRDFGLAEHRQRFGLVLQDVSVFSRDIAGNIDLDRGLSRERIRAAAERLGAHRFIERLENGYDQLMMERGRTLSSGERQLLAFARAMAGDPEILVLDEATSHIDAESEALIKEALVRLTEDRTSIIIAHRLSTIRNADRILVFHHGELREQGTHDELLRRDGIYARLYQLQFETGPLETGANPSADPPTAATRGATDASCD